jgi:hypothetical protein
MSWCKIRLELARTRELPEGSRTRGYELVAPVDAAGHIDEAAWREDKTRARVRRFWEGEEDEHGQLIHTRGKKWAFSYRPGEEDDTPLYHLENHIFREGEYLSITEQDGEALPFKIMAVSKLPDMVINK